MLLYVEKWKQSKIKNIMIEMINCDPISESVWNNPIKDDPPPPPPRMYFQFDQILLYIQ